MALLYLSFDNPIYESGVWISKWTPISMFKLPSLWLDWHHFSPCLSRKANSRTVTLTSQDVGAVIWRRTTSVWRLTHRKFTTLIWRQLCSSSHFPVSCICEKNHILCFCLQMSYLSACYLNNSWSILSMHTMSLQIDVISLYWKRRICICRR